MNERVTAALDRISHEVTEILTRAGVRQSDAYLCGDSAATAVERLLAPDHPQ